MKAEIAYYVKKKIVSEFEKCQWEDGIGRNFQENNLTEMQQAVGRVEDSLEEADKFFRETERLLASITEE